MLNYNPTEWLIVLPKRRKPIRVSEMDREQLEQCLCSALAKLERLDNMLGEIKDEYDSWWREIS